jgi:uncharacterized protein
MKDREPEELLSRVANGRTDLVFDIVAAGMPATQTDDRGVPLIRHCAYYGDVSAIRFLLAHRESLSSLGENFDLNGAAALQIRSGTRRGCQSSFT